jgi:hypothetical protein
VEKPHDLPPEVIEAARISPIQLDVLVLSPSCAIDGVAPNGTTWARQAYRLGLGADGSPWLDVPFVPLRDGFLRVILSWRGQVLQTLRTPVRVDGREGPIRTRVEFAVSTRLADLERLPARRVALTLNDVDGRRAVAVIAPGEKTEVEAAGINAAFFEETVPLLRDLVEESARSPETGMYRFVPDNQGTKETLGAFLLQLAPQGALAWRSLFNRPAGELLRARLQASNAAIQVAGLAEGEAVPWGFLYDLPLRETPARTCLTAIEAGPVNGLLPWEACQARPDCPLAGPDADKVVCPWGFWGFKHRIEEPPMRVDEAPDRELVHEVPVTGPVRTVMGINQTLDKDGRHRASVQAIAGTEVRVAGDAPDSPGPDALQAALTGPQVHLVYLYCHGGVGWGPNKRRVWLSVGRSLEERFAPDQLRYWPLGWESRPLVIVNGCNTTRVDPSQLANFVREFAAQGAAGVVGTETTVWETLAQEVGSRLLAAMVAGKPLGEALLGIRHALLRERYNPLGLVYSAYASVDLRLTRQVGGGRPLAAVGAPRRAEPQARTRSTPTAAPPPGRPTGFDPLYLPLPKIFLPPMDRPSSPTSTPFSPPTRTPVVSSSFPTMTPFSPPTVTPRSSPSRPTWTPFSSPTWTPFWTVESPEVAVAPASVVVPVVAVVALPAAADAPVAPATEAAASPSAGGGGGGGASAVVSGALNAWTAARSRSQPVRSSGRVAKRTRRRKGTSGRWRGRV